MAVKIPDAPNIIGSEPVLRSPEGVNGSTATPQFKHDPSAAVEATNALGTLFANVNQQRVDTYMTQASLWWTENMNKHMRETMDKYKGGAAMDLYVKEIKPYAKKLTEDLLGAPKDDGVVRISNPQLQKEFQKWADGQMRNYNAQIGSYEGQELAKYNESTFDAREQQISEGLMKATTPEEIVGYSKSMLDLNALRYRGYNPDRISQLAAAKVDAAVTTNVQTKIANDVEKGYSYYTDPQVQAVLSTASKTKIQQELRKQLVEQGKARGGEGLANNDTSRVEHYTNQELIRKIYNTEDPEIIRGVQLEIMGGANDRATGLQEKAAGVQSQINATLSAELANAQTEEDLYNVLSRIYETDPTWAESIDKANQMSAIDSAVVRYITTAVPNYQKDVTELSNTIAEELSSPMSMKLKGKGGQDTNVAFYNEEKAYSGRTINSADYERGLLAQADELELSGMSHEQAIKTVAEREARLIVANREDSEDNIEMMARYDFLRDRLANATETYTEVMNDIVAGTYTGGYDARIDKLPLQMQRELYAAVGTQGEYRRLVNSHPGVDEVFKSIDATYPNLDVGFQERAKRMAMYRVSEWEKKSGDVATGQQLRQLVQQGYADAKDPVTNAMESAIRDMVSVDDLTENDYQTRELRTDLMAEQKRLDTITSSATKAFSKVEQHKTAGSRDWDKNVEYARAKIRKFRNGLPKELRGVVDQNMDLYTRWYALGNTNAIINHVNAHRNKY